MEGAYIQHYGVKGMKWGVRRDRRTRGSEDHRTAKKLKKKRLSEMSNTELNTLNKRMRLENEYRSLKEQQSTINRGHRYVKTALALVTTAGAVYKGAKVLNDYLTSGPGAALVTAGEMALAKRK